MYLKKARDVQGDAEPQQFLAAGCAVCAGDQPRNHDMGEEQRQEAHVPPRVEDQRRRHQRPFARADVASQRIVQRKRRG